MKTAKFNCFTINKPTTNKERINMFEEAFGVRIVDDVKPCKRCAKLKHKISCLKLELERHMQKHESVEKCNKDLADKKIDYLYNIAKKLKVPVTECFWLYPF